MIKKSIGHCWVQTGSEVLFCSTSTQLRKQMVYPTTGKYHTVQRVIENDHTDPIAVGDQVRYIQSDGGGMVVEVLPRRNRLSRRAASTGSHAFEQVIAANIDLVMPVFAAARPEPAWNLLDRNLASAESLELPALVCLTKIDLVQEPDGALPEHLLEAVRMYRQIGYDFIFTSAVTGQGFDELRRVLKDKTSVFIGKSGVGKTSLLNAIQPGLGRRVGEVGRETGKGRHTTTMLEMLTLDFGGRLIDTPGMREFGLWDTGEDDLAYFFREMQPYIGKCKFGLNCLHIDEPGCAVRKAVMDGRVDPRRYRSMVIMQENG
ncbi:MAG: ribosome small subunit-dependent GTPase A [Anaerolineaceae bacterium]